MSRQTIGQILVIAASVFVAVEISSLTGLGWFLVFLAIYWVYLSRRVALLREATVLERRASRLLTLSPPVAFFVLSAIFGASFIGENVVMGMSLASAPFLFGVYVAYSVFFAGIVWLVSFLVARNRSSTRL